MKIVLVGQQWLGAQALKLCLRRGNDVLRVLTPGADEGGEYDRLHAAAMQARVPVGVCAQHIGVAHIPSGTDLILAVHAHAYITANARRTARYGALGYHPSLLPRHRGRDAVRWTIHMGERIAGGTAYWMDDGADTGPIAAQDWCHVLPGDDARTLWRRELAPMGLQLFGRVLGELDNGVVKRYRSRRRQRHGSQRLRLAGGCLPVRDGRICNSFSTVAGFSGRVYRVDGGRFIARRFRPCTRATFSELHRLSVGALSQQSPRRLIDERIPYALSVP